jgi:hypothetical protein
VRGPQLSHGFKYQLLLPCTTYSTPVLLCNKGLLTWCPAVSVPSQIWIKTKTLYSLKSWRHTNVTNLFQLPRINDKTLLSRKCDSQTRFGAVVQSECANHQLQLSTCVWDPWTACMHRSDRHRKVRHCWTCLCSCSTCWVPHFVGCCTLSLAHPYLDRCGPLLPSGLRCHSPICNSTDANCWNS